MAAATGAPLRRLTNYANADESPDWQAIPAPAHERALRRCREVRAGGGSSTCGARARA